MELHPSRERVCRQMKWHSQTLLYVPRRKEPSASFFDPVNNFWAAMCCCGICHAVVSLPSFLFRGVSSISCHSLRHVRLVNRRGSLYSVLSDTNHLSEALTWGSSSSVSPGFIAQASAYSNVLTLSRTATHTWNRTSNQIAMALHILPSWNGKVALPANEWKVSETK